MQSFAYHLQFTADHSLENRILIPYRQGGWYRIQFKGMVAGEIIVFTLIVTSDENGTWMILFQFCSVPDQILFIFQRYMDCDLEELARKIIFLQPV